jgi:PERQ amino acid-rich with GYF domain-containing protein
MGKRYADLASKTSATPGSPAGGGASLVQGSGWATVGAGGKVKVPTGPAVQSRTSSVGNIAKPTTPTPAAAAKPAAKPAPTSLKDAKNLAMEEFKKWLHRELGRGLIGVSDSEFSSSSIA